MRNAHQEGLPVRSETGNSHARCIRDGSQKPAGLVLCLELQMFAATQEFLRREYERLHALPPAFRPQAQIAELKVRSHQLILDVTRWMEREAQA